MAKLKKYQPASRFDNDADALYWLRSGYYFWFQGRPYHAAFINGWSVMMFFGRVHDGSLTRAKISGAWLAAAVNRDISKLEQVA